MAPPASKIFISYNRADRDWAEWIAETIEVVGYKVIIQAWDFRPGESFVLRMQQAATEANITIAVLSEAYLKAEFTQPEWAAALSQDPTGVSRRLIPVRVGECRLTGMPDALIRLQRADLGAIKKAFLGYPYPDLLRAIEASVDALESGDRERYLDLAVFPEDQPIPRRSVTRALESGRGGHPRLYGTVSGTFACDMGGRWNKPHPA